MDNQAPATPSPGTPAKASHSPGDSTQLVSRLQALKSRLANMAKTLEDSVAAASPIKGKQEEDILYTTLSGAKKLLDNDVAQESSIFLAENEKPEDGDSVMEIRFTLAGKSDEEIEEMLKMLQQN